MKTLFLKLIFFAVVAMLTTTAAYAADELRLVPGEEYEVPHFVLSPEDYETRLNELEPNEDKHVRVDRVFTAVVISVTADGTVQAYAEDGKCYILKTSKIFEQKTCIGDTVVIGICLDEKGAETFELLHALRANNKPTVAIQ